MRKTTAKMLAIFSAAAMITSCTRIDAGYEGIKVKQYGTGKGVQNTTLVTGRVWYNPFTEDVVEFPLFVQNKDYEPFELNSKDGSVFTVDPTLAYRVMADMSPQIYVKYRKNLDDITQTSMLNYVKDAYRIQLNNYTTEQLISNRAQFENAVQNSLTDLFKKEGFHLEGLTSGLVYPKSITDAVNAKNAAVQQAMQSQNQLVKDSIEAKRKLIVAMAEKQANDLKQSSLTPMLIQQMFIEKWDGKTPLYGNAPTLFRNVQ